MLIKVSIGVVIVSDRYETLVLSLQNARETFIPAEKHNGEKLRLICQVVTYGAVTFFQDLVSMTDEQKSRL
jgi:hypothetical protein